jgi:hypothetical protein
MYSSPSKSSSVCFLEIDSGSAQGKGELAAVVEEKEGCGRWRSDNAEDLWRVGDLEYEISTVRGAVWLDQELHRTNLCNARSTYAPWDIILNEGANAPLPEEYEAWHQWTVAI